MLTPDHVSRRILSFWIGRLRRLRHDHRASVGLLTGLSAPTLLMATAMGVEVSHWASVHTDLQRTADMSAIAGVAALARNETPQQAANAAANMAEMNGAPGGSRTWNPNTYVLSDNYISVAVTAGIRNSADSAVAVTVRSAIPLLFSRIMVRASSISLGATGTAELAPQPCVLALGSTGGITVSGNVTASFLSCSLYSDSTIKMSGSVSIDAAALYATGKIATGSAVTGTAAATSAQNSGAPSVPDPYANDRTMLFALSQADCFPAQQPAVSGNTVTMEPNTCYGSISINGTQALVFDGPGLYTVNGSITVTGNSSLGTSISGSGITIVSTGPLSVSGTFNSGAVVLTAATVNDATNGAIPGVLFATSSSKADTVAGTSAIPFTGLLYMPNAALAFSGTPSSASNGCAKVIAQTVSLVGNSTVASNCSDYNLATFGMIADNYLIRLVE